MGFIRSARRCSVPHGKQQSVGRNTLPHVWEVRIHGGTQCCQLKVWHSQLVGHGQCVSLMPDRCIFLVSNGRQHTEAASDFALSLVLLCCVLQLSWSPQHPTVLATSALDKRLLVWDISRIGAHQVGCWGCQLSLGASSSLVGIHLQTVCRAGCCRVVQSSCSTLPGAHAVGLQRRRYLSSFPQMLLSELQSPSSRLCRLGLYGPAEGLVRLPCYFSLVLTVC
jgi:hypothetical protein